MTQDEAKRLFVAMQPEQQQRLLAVLALNITVAARTAYPGQIDESLAPGRLLAFNEVVHTIAGQLVRLLDGDSRRYPDDVLIDALFELAQKADCTRDLADAFAWSFSAS